MEQVNLLLLLDLVALLAVLATAVGPMIREVRHLLRRRPQPPQQLLPQLLHQEPTTRVEHSLPRRRQPRPPLQPQPMIRVERHPRHRLPQLLQQARVMTMS
jgi:hypothetical protein